MILAAALLFAFSINDLGRSALVEQSHDHAWNEIYNGDKGIIWFDESWRQNATVNEVDYPTVLTRFELPEVDGAVAIGDAILAVDCTANRVEMTEIWGRHPNLPGDARKKFSPIVFEDADDPVPEDDKAVLSATCGKDWKP